MTKVALQKTSRTDGTAYVDTEAFGALLLDLYRFARELTLADFQRCVLERVSEVLPFDAAWWGMTTPNRELHSSYPFKLPPRFVEHWTSIRDHDILAGEVERNPGVTILYGAKHIERDTFFAKFFSEFTVRQTLCTLLLNPTLNLSTFLSLYRLGDNPPFTEAERQFKQLVMPHLWAAWTSNWIAQLASAQAHSFSSRVALAVADQRGILHAAEPRFSELVKSEWPQWQGPALPPAVSGRHEKPYAGAEILTRLLPVCGLFLVEVRALSPLDRLTARELSIAARFGNGESYKEIAAALPVSPATVRAHLRAIYTKLGISDKTELANLLSAHSEARRPPLYM